MVRRSSEKLTIDSAFHVPKCDELLAHSKSYALRKSEFRSYPVHGVTPRYLNIHPHSYSYTSDLALIILARGHRLCMFT